jgi:excisionase family DNA binding protein
MQVIDRQNKLKIPSESEMELSTLGSRILSSVQNSDRETQTIKVEASNGEEQSLLIPTFAYELFIDILSQIAQGNAVTLIPVHAELSTQQAANILNVSRPHLIKLLESGEIPYYKVGKHRRILAQKLYDYKSDIDAKRSQTLDELTAFTQELGLDDD